MSLRPCAIAALYVDGTVGAVTDRKVKPLLLLLLLLLCGGHPGRSTSPSSLSSAASPGGDYGEWRTDALGLPVFSYTFDQVTNSSRGASYTPSAADPWDSIHWGELPLSTANTIRTHSEHIFQLGNSRLVVLASNFGSVRVRQDEGGPKFLQDASAAFPDGFDVSQDGGTWRLKDATQFGGGFGYLLDDADRPLLTSYYTGADDAPLPGCKEDRLFGIGWTRTVASTPDFAVSHTLAVPFGDDPVVLIEVNVTNRGNTAAKVKWAEVWSSLLVHLDLKELRNTDRRSFSARHYRSSFSRTPAGHNGVTTGLQHAREWLPLTAEELLHANDYLEHVQLPPNASLFDEEPPIPFLLRLDGNASFGNDARAFFGVGGPRSAAAKTLVLNETVGELDAALIAAVEMQLPPSETQSVRCLVDFSENRLSCALPNECVDTGFHAGLFGATPSRILAAQVRWQHSHQSTDTCSKGVVGLPIASHSCGCPTSQTSACPPSRGCTVRWRGTLIMSKVACPLIPISMSTSLTKAQATAMDGVSKALHATRSNMRCRWSNCSR